VRGLVPPDLRRVIQRTRSVLGVQATRVRPWNWQLVGLTPVKPAPYRVLYAGTKDRRPLIQEVLGLELVEGAAPVSFDEDTALLSELPLPGSLRLPWCINSVVPLGRSVDQLLASYDGELRRRLRKHHEYRLRQILDPEEAAEISRTMLEPYAVARHQDHAQQIPVEAITRMIGGTSGARLDLLLQREEAVACHLGFPFTRGGQRYWETIRFGYPPHIFSAPRRLAEINSMNTFLALVWAIENGFDYYNIGQAPAHPDAGLLQWKRRRGGAAWVLHNDGFFFLRLPSRGAAQFLWDAPLFARQGRSLVLHLGLPEGRDDDQVANRYREMGYGGISRVYLHCARPPTPQLLAALQGSWRQASPALQTVASS